MRQASRGDDPADEVRVFEANALEGVRTVATVWLTRRIALPLGAMLAAVALVALVQGQILQGALAGGFAVLILAPLWRFLRGQWRRIFTYLKGDGWK